MIKAQSKQIVQKQGPQSEEDFPSLHPGKEVVRVKTWDENKRKLHVKVESVPNSKENFPTLSSPQKSQKCKEPQQVPSESNPEITSMEQHYLNFCSQYFEYPVIFDWNTGQYFYNPMYFMPISTMAQPQPKNQQKPVQTQKAPLVRPKKQVFTWIEPKSQKKSDGNLQQKQGQHKRASKKRRSKKNLKKNHSNPADQVSSSSEPQKPVEEVKSVEISSKVEKQEKQQKVQKQTDEQKRPLDRYALQIINRYKKELRKESSDTTVSDREDRKSESEGKLESEEEQMDTVEEIEKNHTIMEFRLGHVFPKVIRGRFERAFKHPYSTHYEYLKAKTFIPPIEKVKEIEWITLGHLRVLNINLDLNIASRGFDYEPEELQELQELYSKRKTKVYYGNVTDQERAEQFIEIIKEAMSKGVDFILLQEGYQSIIRSKILYLIEELASYQFGKYFYPDNIENFQFNRTTLILSKHPVRFGQLQFEIVEHEHQKPNKFYFPLQAFCEFQILINKKVERIGIFNCHLRSNGERNSKIPPWRMRQKQLDCIHDWGKRQSYARFFVIGDTNMPSGEKFKSENIEADAKFFDAFDQGFTPIGGTYSYKNERNQVVDERMDRVLMNKECAQNTVVEIQYEDVLLKSCEGMGLERKKMLEMYQNQLTYITLSDHKMMDITIYMTEKK